MQTLVLEGSVTALTSISHIGESRGITSLLRREKIVMPNGQSVEEIPIISGNSLRGMLRDRGMLHMCRLLGYGVNEKTGEVQGLTLPAFYFLFSGGSLTKHSDKAMDLGYARRLRELIPLIGLFGGAVGNQILPGKLKIGKLIPICTETKHLLPEKYSDVKISIWDLLQTEAYTRKDDEKNEHLRILVAPEDLKALKAPKKKHKNDVKQKRIADVSLLAEEPMNVLIDEVVDDLDREIGQHQQMRYHFEVFSAGTKFFWDIVLDDPTDIEFEAFALTMFEFAKHPYIGGRSAIGHGKVAVNFDEWIEINPRCKAEGKMITPKMGKVYVTHIEKHKEEIQNELQKIS